MFNKNNWNEPLYKQDVIAVVVNGLVAAILAGILGGAIEYLFDMLGFSISINLLLIAFLVGLRVRRGYYTYHILYPVLAIVFLLVGLLISHYSYIIFYHLFVNKSSSGFMVIFTKGFWISFLLNPVSTLILGISIKSPLNIVLGIIDLAITAWSFYFVFLMAKGNNR